MVKSLLIITEWGKVADYKNSYYEKMLILFFSYNFSVHENWMKSYVKQSFRCIKNSTIGVFFNQGNQEQPLFRVLR